MALQHAILVSLCEQAGSGYELARRFDRTTAYFWAATHQQIYRALRVMEDDGWIQASTVTQHGRPDKKVYAVSAKGRTELARWIAEPLSPRSRRRGTALSDNSIRDLSVKLRGAVYGAKDSVAALGAQIAALRAERLDLLDTYRGLEKRAFGDSSARRGAALHRYLVLRGGIRAEESTIDWLDEVANALQDGQ